MKKSFCALISFILLFSPILALEDSTFVDQLNSSVSDENLLLTVTASKRLGLVGDTVFLTASMTSLTQNDLNASLTVVGASGYMIKAVTAAGGGGNTWTSGWIRLSGGSSKDVTLTIEGTNEIRTGVSVQVRYDKESLSLDMPIAFTKGYCGDGICSSWENPSNCCMDCHCPTGQSCNTESGVCEAFGGLTIQDVIVYGVIVIVIIVLLALLLNPKVDWRTKAGILRTLVYLIFMVLQYGSKKGKKKGSGDTLVTNLPTVCPHCGSISFSSGGGKYSCTNCGRTFRKTG
ncbi:MAG: hypothetical protein GOU97_04885 [Nanoarchaeota archaeon]|nr:hypothetical protein [Nanoarchaeota archaeon]